MTGKPKPKPKGAAKPACPICGKPVPGPEFRPFCSRRCKEVDLNRWLGEVYRVPVTPESDEDGDEQSDERTITE